MNADTGRLIFQLERLEMAHSHPSPGKNNFQCLIYHHTIRRAAVILKRTQRAAPLPVQSWQDAHRRRWSMKHTVGQFQECSDAAVECPLETEL